MLPVVASAFAAKAHGGKPRQIILHHLVLLTAIAVEYFPCEKTCIMAIAEGQSHSIIANRRDAVMVILRLPAGVTF